MKDALIRVAIIREKEKEIKKMKKKTRPCQKYS